MPLTQSNPRLVLYISPNAKLGGAENSLRLFLKYHDRKRFIPSVFFLNDGPLVEEFQSFGISCYIGPKTRLRSPVSVLNSIWDIVRVIRDNEIDIVHSVMGYGHIYGGLAAFLARKPEVWYQHGPITKSLRFANYLPTKLTLFNSEFTKNAHIKCWGSVKGYKIIYPGVERIDSKKYVEQAHLFRKKFHIPGSSTVFGLVGRISPMKGHKVVIEAAARLRDQGYDFKVLLIGEEFMNCDNQYRKYLNKLIQELKLSDIVIFTGFVSPVYTATVACDVLLNTSATPEPFGFVIVEAMMLERPIIASGEGGPLEIFTDEVEGLFFKPGNADSLSEAMAKLLKSSDLRQEMGKNGVIAAKRKYTIERMTNELENEYSSIIDQ